MIFLQRHHTEGKVHTAKDNRLTLIIVLLDLDLDHTNVLVEHTQSKYMERNLPTGHDALLLPQIARDRLHTLSYKT